ncbi:hypothetical protein N9D31_00185 [Oligoflexaceae bacterium]|nr:hypothetical protein [Oligoflexaceae bacterium]
MTRLTFSRGEEDGWITVKLNGAIIEGSKEAVSSLTNQPDKKIIFDFENVTSINTCGIAEWIKFISDFGKQKNVIYDACSSNIIMLINMVPAFRGGAEIRSLFRTYFCDKCEKTIEVAVVKGKNMPSARELKENPNFDDEIKCSKCNGEEPLEAEVPAEEFFEFIFEEN